MDRRQQKTRKNILIAFRNLLNRKNFCNITVQEIIDEANVGRSTFYSHFETKDFLLKEMCLNMFNHVFDKNLKKESNHDFSLSEHNIKDEITHVLYHLKEHSNNLKGLFYCNKCGNIFIKYLRDYLEEMFLPVVKKMNSKAPNDYVLNFLVCAFSDTVKWWIIRNEEYTPEEVTNFFIEFINLPFCY